MTCINVMVVLKFSSFSKENAMFESPAAVFIHSACVTLPPLPTSAANLLFPHCLGLSYQLSTEVLKVQTHWIMYDWY